eukprot:5787394-Pleurochrysis_carterae.AAC.2
MKLNVHKNFRTFQAAIQKLARGKQSICHLLTATPSCCRVAQPAGVALPSRRLSETSVYAEAVPCLAKADGWPARCRKLGASRAHQDARVDGEVDEVEHFGREGAAASLDAEARHAARHASARQKAKSKQRMGGRTKGHLGRERLRRTERESECPKARLLRAARASRPC